MTRAARRLALMGVAAVLLASCEPQPVSTHRLEPLFVMQEVAVGSNRFTMGLLEDGKPIPDGSLQVRFRGPQGSQGAQASLSHHGQGFERPGLYVASVRFDRAGPWVAQVTASSPRAGAQSRDMPFTVLASSVTPAVGSPAPRSRNLTARDVKDIRQIDTGVPLNDMHGVSIADAIAAHRPALVVFATPAYCASRVCGPQVSIVQTLEPKYRDRVAFIHVEIYELAQANPTGPYSQVVRDGRPVLAPVVAEWHLQSEPWVFLIDRQGNVAAKFEGPTPAADMAEELDKIV
jgi:hypothetical protein